MHSAGHPPHSDNGLIFLGLISFGLKWIKREVLIDIIIIQEGQRLSNVLSKSTSRQRTKSVRQRAGRTHFEVLDSLKK